MGLSGRWSSRSSTRRSSASAPRLDIERDLSAWKASRWAAARSPGRDGGSGWSDRKLMNRRVVCQVPSAEASVRSPPLMPVRAASAAATGARQPARGSPAVSNTLRRPSSPVNQTSDPASACRTGAGAEYGPGGRADDLPGPVRACPLTRPRPSRARPPAGRPSHRAPASCGSASPVPAGHAGK